MRPLLAIAAVAVLALSPSCALVPEAHDHDPRSGALTVCLTGPPVAERDSVNPFLQYRFNVKVSGPEGNYTVPGYFAADGQADSTSAVGGDQWCAQLQGFAAGTYTYRGLLERDDSIALRETAYVGEAVGVPLEGTFTVASDTLGDSDGWLRYDSSGYPRFSQSGRLFLKGGTNSPENFLAFADFDGTYSYDSTKTFVKTYPAHVRDWRSGDPTWGVVATHTELAIDIDVDIAVGTAEDTILSSVRSRGIIGALNYLAAEGVNGIYVLTNNIGGDARDVWPYVSHDTLDRFDVSKLAQWERVFAHAEHLGIHVQVVTQETENETLLDHGDTGPLRRLYYRELVARFGHHRMLTWNLGEENGPTPWTEDPAQTDAQRSAMVAWFEANDPYRHPVVIHTLPNGDQKAPILDPLLGNASLAGISLQISEATDVHAEVLRWRQRSDSAGRRWMLAMDEIGPWHTGSLADAADARHDTLRREVLWGSYMAGAYGVEWYYGWLTDQNDLDAEDFRSREQLWRQTLAARTILEPLPLADMHPADSLVTAGWCLTDETTTYVLYLPAGGSAVLTLGGDIDTDDVRITWYDPQTAKSVAGSEPLVATEGSSGTGSAVGVVVTAPDEAQDWVAVLR